VIAMEFYEWYQENPNQVTVVLLIMVCIIVSGFCVQKHSQHKEKKRLLRAKLIKQKYNIK
jgi:hypothetical protein